MNNMFQTLSMIMQLGNNPEQIAQNLMNQNPQFCQLVNQYRNSGMTPQQFFNQYCRQNNIDPNAAINLARKIGIKL